MANMILTRELFRHNCEEQEKLDTHIYKKKDVKEAITELRKDWKLS